MGNPSSCPVIGDAPSCQCSQAGPRCFMGKHEHDASTGLRLLWCRSGGFIRKPEHDARGCTRGWMYSFPPIPLLNCTITCVVTSGMETDSGHTWVMVFAGHCSILCEVRHFLSLQLYQRQYVRTFQTNLAATDMPNRLPHQT